MSRLTHLFALAVLAAGGLTQIGCGSSSSGGTTPLAPPAPPTGLVATAADGAVGLGWAPVTGATSYGVYRAVATGALASKTKVGTATASAYNDTTVTNDVAYFYQVTASNAAGESGGSAEATATPSASLPPAAPTGVTATAAPSQVTLTWGTVPSATSYNVYWSTSTPVVRATANQITGATSPRVIGALTNGTAYYFVVTAVNGNGESANSLEVSATPTVPPPYIVALVIRWPAVLPGVPVLEVRVCETASCMASVSNATVRVNGTALTWNAANEAYDATSPMPAAGAGVTVTVTIPAGGAVRAGTYTATGTMYTSAPSVTSPTVSTTWTRSSANTMTWTGGAPTVTTPASAYVVGIMDTNGNFYPPSTQGGPFEEPIGTTSYTLPANTITVAGTYVAWVGIATGGIVSATGSDGLPFTGALAGSGLYLGYVGAFVQFTVN